MRDAIRAAGVVRLPLAALVLGLVLAGSGSASNVNDAGTDAYRRGDYATAERLFREGLRKSPRDPVLHYHLGVTLTQVGRWREAAEALQTALRLQPPPAVEAGARETLNSLRPMLTARRAPPGETITLRHVHGVWVAEVIVNDRYPATFLVDTGASICVISPVVAERAGIRPGADVAPITLSTLAGRTSGQPVRVPSITVGDLQARDVEAVIHPTGAAFDGILGNSFLGRYNASLDPKRGVLELYPK